MRLSFDHDARLVELADTYALGAYGATLESSSLSSRTNENATLIVKKFVAKYAVKLINLRVVSCVVGQQLCRLINGNGGSSLRNFGTGSLRNCRTKQEHFPTSLISINPQLFFWIGSFTGERINDTYDTLYRFVFTGEKI